MTTICPHCGYDLQALRQIEDGRFTFSPGLGLLVDGRLADLSPTQHEIAGSLMFAAGRPLSREVLAERLGYDGDGCCNLINVQVFRMRRRMSEIPLPIENMPKRGLRWRFGEAGRSMITTEQSPS